MRAGQLRHRISVDEAVDTQNETGEEVTDFVEADTVWGSVEPLHGREALMAQQVNAELTTRIRIRWSSEVDAITPKWRLRHHNIIYNILSIAHIDMRHREIEMMCSSGVNLG